MRRLILALACGALVVLPALAQPQQDSQPGGANPIESIGNTLRDLFNRIFGGAENRPAEPAPVEAAKPPPPEAGAPPAAVKGSPVARAADRSLHEAITKGELDTVVRMLDRGADIEAKDPGAGASPLHFAVMKGDPPVVELLVKRGADVNSRTRNGTTPLHTAVLYSRLGAVNFLVQKGADVNAKSVSGATPLALAVAAKNEPIIARLKELGAN